MLNKEQMFVLQEFITKNANKNIWQITDKLVYTINELIEIENAQKQTSSIHKETAPQSI